MTSGKKCENSHPQLGSPGIALDADHTQIPRDEAATATRYGIDTSANHWKKKKQVIYLVSRHNYPQWYCGNLIWSETFDATVFHKNFIVYLHQSLVRFAWIPCQVEVTEGQRGCEAHRLLHQLRWHIRHNGVELTNPSDSQYICGSISGLDVELEKVKRPKIPHASDPNMRIALGMAFVARVRRKFRGEASTTNLAGSC